MAKEAADAKARLEGLSTNLHREEKANRLGGGDIRRRQLGNIASILGGGPQPTRRKRIDTTSSDLRDKKRAFSPSDEELPAPRKRAVSDIRKRQLGDIAAILGGRPNKRQRADGASEREERGGNRMEVSSDEENNTLKGAKSKSGRNEVEDTRRSRSHIARDESEEGERNSHRSDRRRHHSTSERREKYERSHRGKETLGNDERSNRKRRRTRSRSRSPREHRKKDSRHRDRSSTRRRSISPNLEKGRKSFHSRRSPTEPKVSDMELKAQKAEKLRVDYDSDPLDDIIGPRPPPVEQIRSRGRGVMSQGSGIDSRFSASYDPTVDVQLDPDEENDWDQALEALRDRQKWQKSGADRLRSAGFTEDEITKWEKGGEKREEDVKWSKQGESREWDRGKVVGDDGAVTQEASWGRLKGT